MYLISIENAVYLYLLICKMSKLIQFRLSDQEYAEFGKHHKKGNRLTLDANGL
jgi:hypothetical protein